MTPPKEKARSILAPFKNTTDSFTNAKRSAALAVSLAAGVASQHSQKLSAYWLEVRDELDQLTSFD